MNIKRFEDFLSEPHHEDNVYEEVHISDEEYDELDESFVEAIKGLLQKPNLKDPKTPKDFAELVRVAASKMPEGKGTPMDIASKIRNLMSAYINKVGPFKKRSGDRPAKPVSVMVKGGVEKAISNFAKSVVNTAKGAFKNK